MVLIDLNKLFFLELFTAFNKTTQFAKLPNLQQRLNFSLQYGSRPIAFSRKHIGVLPLMCCLFYDFWGLYSVTLSTGQERAGPIGPALS